jgi:hypothetical protein
VLLLAFFEVAVHALISLSPRLEETQEQKSGVIVMAALKSVQKLITLHV